MPDDKKLFKNDIGVLFKVYAGVDLSDASSIIMKIRKPSGVVSSWTASVDTDNSFYALYSTISGDLNIAGEYFISLSLTTVDGKSITGQSDSFMVYDQFYDLMPPNRYQNVY